MAKAPKTPATKPAKKRVQRPRRLQQPKITLTEEQVVKPRTMLKDENGLTPLERIFVKEYLGAGFNATEAMRRTGSKSKNPGLDGHMLLKKPKVAAAVLAAMEERERVAGVNAERLLREIHDIALVDPADLFDPETGALLPLNEMPTAARRAICAIDVEELFERDGSDRVRIGRIKKIRLVSKEGMITLAGKHLAMFQDRVKVDADVSYTIVTGVPDASSDAK